MPVTQYMGSSGILMRQLEQTMPGAYAFVFASAILIGILFVYKINRFQENPKEVFMYFGLLGLMSFILFGNMAAFLGIMLIVGSYWFYARHAWAKAETVPAGGRELEKAYFPKESEFRQRLEAIEKSIEAKKGPAAALAKEEREVETIEDYEDVLVAAEEDMSAKMQQEISAEKSAEEKEQGLVNALVGYGNTIEQQLQKMGSMEAIDAAGKRFVLNSVQGMSQVCQQIAVNERDLNNKRLQFVSGLINDVEVLKDVTSRADRLSKGASQLERSLSKDLGKDIIDKVQTVLSKKRADLKSLMSQAASLRKNLSEENRPLFDGVQVQLNALRTEIGQIEQELYRLKSMQSQLSSALAGIGKILGDVRQLLNTLSAQEKKVNAHEAQILKFQVEFPKMLEKLDAASASFSGVVSELSSEGVGIAERIPIKATISIGNIFTEILNLQKEALKFKQEGALPFVSDLLDVLNSSAPLNNLMKVLHDSFQKVSQGFETLVSAAEKIVEYLPEEEFNKIDELETSIENVAVTEEQERVRMTQKATNALQTSRTALEQNITQLSSLIVATESSERKLLDELTRSLNAIVLNKTGVNREFQAKAAQFTAQMSQAQATVEKARAA